MSQELPTLDPLATFVDVGSEHMHVSVAGNKPQGYSAAYSAAMFRETPGSATRSRRPRPSAFARPY